MKTVMKKMFSLLLVAVLLVGMVPFQASAEEMIPLTLTPGQSYTVDDTFVSTYYTGSGTPTKYYVHNGGLQGETFTAIEERDYFLVIEEFAAAHTHTPGAAATCTTAQTCTDCGETLVAALGHDIVDGACTRCTYEEPKTTATVEVFINNVGTGKSFTVDAGKNTNEVFAAFNASSLAAQYAGANGPILTLADSSSAVAATEAGKAYWLWLSLDSTTPDPEPQKCATCESTEHTTANCPYCAICWEDGDQVKTHKTSEHCPKCDTIKGHAITCEDYPQTGDSLVTVYVNLYNSDTKIATKELVVYKESSEAPVYSSIAKHEDLINSKLAAKYPDYTWYGNVYDADNDDDAEQMKGTVGKGVTVHINAYSAEDLVLIAVHNSRTMSPLGGGYVHLHGKKIGDVVTAAEVRKAISKYYSVGSMSMYSEQQWEDYVGGDNTIKPVDTLTVNSEPYFIDVRISGSAISSSGSGSSADSSNPKTGDAVFTPVIVMVASVSALATLFFLNKKRAY